jgi:hypothetical protein
MQRTIEQIAALNNVDLKTAKPGDVYLKVKSPGFMDLVIEKPYPNTVSVAHYYEQAGDLIQDPEMTFLIGYRWYAITIQHAPPFSQYVELATFEDDDRERGTFHAFYPRLQRDAAIFANKWAENLRRQGFVKQVEIDRPRQAQGRLW